MKYCFLFFNFLILGIKMHQYRDRSLKRLVAVTPGTQVRCTIYRNVKSDIKNKSINRSINQPKQLTGLCPQILELLITQPVMLERTIIFYHILIKTNQTRKIRIFSHIFNNRFMRAVFVFYSPEIIAIVKHQMIPVLALLVKDYRGILSVVAACPKWVMVCAQPCSNETKNVQDFLGE